MSTKTVALDSRVYERLAAAKREGESFSGTVDRLLRHVGAAHTGRDILHCLESVAPLADEDAEVFLAVVAGNRASESWQEHDLG